MLLGDVRKIQEVRECARQRRRGFDRERCEERRQFRELRLIARTRGLRQRANALDGLEQLLAAASPEGLAEEFPQQPHIIAQRLMRVGDHLLIVEQIEQRDCFAAYRCLQRRPQIG